MQNSTRKWTMNGPSRAMEDAVDRFVHTRMTNSVEASMNIRVRLTQRISAVCREVITSYLDDERQTMSTAFATDAMKDDFCQRHEQIRKLLNELDELDPKQDNGLALLGKVANTLEEYVQWEDKTLYPSIESILQAQKT